MHKAIVLVLLLVSACASSTGVVSTGQDSYMISRGGGSAFDGVGQLKADAIREGNAFCSKDGKQFQLKSVDEQASGFARLPHADIFFMCIDQNKK